MSDTIKDPNKSVPHPVKTDHEIGQDNITPFGLDIHNPVFLISGISTLVFVAVTLMFQDGAARTDWAPEELRRAMQSQRAIWEW